MIPRRAINEGASGIFLPTMLNLIREEFEQGMIFTEAETN